MRDPRELYALERGREKNVEENISPELPSLTTVGNFERRAKLRGLRSQEELLSAQHICKSVHSLKCLSRGFGIFGCPESTDWLVPAARVGKPRLSPGSERPRVMSLHFSVTA